MKTSLLHGGPLPETEDEFHNNLARMKYHYCSDCKRLFSPFNTHSAAGWRETQISSMCEDCFDALFTGQENEDA